VGEGRSNAFFHVPAGSASPASLPNMPRDVRCCIMINQLLHHDKSIAAS
jgi:hypothetical protein